MIQKRLDTFFAEFGKIEITEQVYYNVQDRLEKYSRIIKNDEKTVPWQINALEQIGVTEPFSKPAIIDFMVTPKEEVDQAEQDKPKKFDLEQEEESVEE